MRSAVINIEDIVIPEAREREVDNGKVGEIAKSIQTLGLLNPIIITIDRKTKVTTLVAGAHRVKASLLLGHETIDARVVKDPRDIKLIEIDENYKRNDLSPQERKQHMTRRIEEITLRFKDEIYKKAIEESIENGNLSKLEEGYALKYAKGEIAEDHKNLKPKALEVGKKARNALNSHAVDVVSGEFDVSKRYVKDAIRKIARKKAEPINRPSDVTVEQSIEQFMIDTNKKISSLVTGLEAQLSTIENKDNGDNAQKLESLRALLVNINKLKPS
ncbi:hypothetical protein VCR12J2_1030085 [Vibrio coralliirubri]|uniref:ParB N-terminal domain-containing protein n=1 Tax=Vibrio coralliirubri TaxID=1516159 RepID=UPI000634940D|nr:ParB N-terminal domain-containing protein [Vibrio coralliirubri]CDT80727.1 hypothetical protein VCR12J2_1030085 [Vibrio coralliirubri]